MDLAYLSLGAVDIWWEGGCWEWWVCPAECFPVWQANLLLSRDVAAGICIVQEAGGLVTNGSPPDDPMNSPIEKVRLGGRHYMGIR